MLGIVVGTLSFAGIVLYFLYKFGYFGRRSNDSCCGSDCADCLQANCGDRKKSSRKLVQIAPLDKKTLFLFAVLSLFVSGCGESASTLPEPRKPKFIVSLTDSDFLERTRKGVVLIDAYAVWCGPCRKMEPNLEKVAEALQGKVLVARIDAEANREFSRYFRVEAFPTVYVLVDGKQVGKPVLGYQTEEQLLRLVKDLIPKASEQPEAESAIPIPESP